MAEQDDGSGARTGLEVAVVGMAGRFPGADDIHAFWRNLRDGVESISFFTPDQLHPSVKGRLADPNFVPAMGEVRGGDELDAGVFGLSPRDAEIMNPQHRLFLECAWSALEHAGYDPARLERSVGAFGGSGINAYMQRVERRADLMSAVGFTRVVLSNDKDHMVSGTAYRLNLRGPAMAVQTACSTSLVAVHVACQSLINGECDLALAGGAAIDVPFRTGYLYSPDGIASPDGHCRAFDADARGAVRGNGAAVVVLKRLDDALADGDTIHAVIRGSAINNDGAQKVGYTAPSVTGQARVIREALSVAGVDVGTVDYLETHGTGTPLGDAIELKALGEVLARAGEGRPLAIGSVKTNVGHMDAAAGVTGLIKTVLSLGHRQIPPSLHCAAPHPGIEALGGRVFVNTTLRPWARNGTPRRAGVSSFGIGGTNAHVVLEEAPAPAPPGPSRALQLLVLSARTPTALAAAAERLAAYLEAEAPPLADAAFTLQNGRAQMEHRLAVVCRDAEEGAARLREAAGRASPPVPRGARPVAFLFPGLGTHYVDMGRGLYRAEPAFRAAVDACCELLRPVLGSDLRDLLFPSASDAPDEADPSSGDGGAKGGWDLRRLLGRRDAEPASPLDDTRVAQPAVFVVEYALAKLWESWGVRPAALAGHSLGEYVAACVAEVMTLEDALRLVALRARLIDALPGGAMLAVPLGEAALRAHLPPELDVAAVNTPESCVVSGPAAAVEAFQAALAERGTVSRRLPARHAFHSRAMEAAAGELEALVAGFELRAPEVRFVSNVTGTWITDEEARSPAYWARHLCRTVRFADCVATLRGQAGLAFLEVGPGQALGAWAAQHAADAPGDALVFSSLRHQHNRVGDARFLLETLGGLWAAGVEVDWAAFSAGERRGRIPLPGYPFERERYWVDPPSTPAAETWAEAPIETTPRPVDGAAGGTDLKGPYEMEDRPAAALPPEAAPSPRQEALGEMLREIVSAVTGMRGERVRMDADLFQAGLDSLLLLQAIQAVEKRVGVRVSLVELLEDIGTLGHLAAHLDRILPPDVTVVVAGGKAASAAAAPIVPAFTPPTAPSPGPAAEPQPRQVPAPPAVYPPASFPADAPAAGDGALERLFAQQLQAMNHLMAQQIAAVTGAASAAASPLPADAAAASASPTGYAADGERAAPRVPRVEPAPRALIQPDTFVPHRAVNPEGRGGLTPRQAEYLEGFIARFVEKTKASKAHQVRYHAPLADGRVSSAFRRAWKEILYPIVGSRALGSRIWDVDGNEYVDTGMSYGCNLFGHAPEFVSAAIRDQVERGYGVGPQSPDAGRAAALICELGGNDRAAFCNSGTEAVMGAIRAARTFTGRNKIAVFSGAYHGWADIVLGRLTPAGLQPTLPGVSPTPLQDVLMLEWDSPASLETLARHLDEIALVMVEPVQSRRLDIHPRDFLHALRRMTREAGALLLFDELITGFRIQPGGAQAHFDVQADLVTYGKIVAGGLPMGVVAGRKEVMDVLDGGVFHYGDDSYPTAQRTFFAGAFFKHPLSMAVAVSILEEIRRQGPEMYARLNARAEALVARLNAFFQAGRYPIFAARFGSTFRFFFGREFAGNSDLFHHHLVLNGVYVIPETGTHFLSTAHTDDDLELFFQAVRLSSEALRGGGFIPDPPPDPPAGDSAPAPRAPRAESGPSSSATAALNGGASSAPRAADDGAGALSTGGPRDGGEVRVLPLSEGQRQLWVESQMGDDANRAYIESSSIRLTGALDVEALRRAVAGVVARHDTLRVTFAPDGETQHVHPSMPAEVPLEDLRALPATDRAAALEAWTTATVRRPFDLEAGPLFRFALAALEDEVHVLTFTFHHAVLDGQSAQVVVGDLGALYRAWVEGRLAVLEPRPDHAGLVRAQTGAVRDNAAAQAYWEAQFADGIPVLELPTDRPRPPSRDYAGGSVTRTAPLDLMLRLAAAGRGHGLTLFNTLLAALFAWLERVTGESDLVVGSPAAGQLGTPGHAELVGFDINVLPIRVRVSPAAPFAEHARRVRRAVAGAVEHQAFSFPRLVEKLLKRRDPSRPPVFSVLMHLDRSDGPGDLGGLRAEHATNFTGGSKVDLTFDLTETPEGLRLRLVYAAALFDRDTAERWLASFERLLEAVAADPARPLSELPLAGDEERRLVVDEWNRTAHPYPHACIHALFEAQAERTPDAPAVVFGGEVLTYAELDAAANRLAHHLRRRGVGPEDRVALCMERGPELMAAFFGILKAGAAYVPLEPTHPAERLAFMLDDSGARLLLTQSRLEARLPAARPETLAVDALAEALAAESADRPESGVLPENLAYVYYTSGSTGRPKGVAMHHYGPANYFAWGIEAYAPERGRGAPVFSSMAVDLTLANFIPLFAGERIELLPEGPGVEPLADAIRAAPGYGMIKITPTHLSLLNQLLTPDEAAASTATLVIGADNLFAEPTLPWQAGAPGVRLLNEYGPTETVVGCSLYEIPPGRHAAGRVPIGRPIHNLTMYVLDGALHPAPPALPGELYIGGVGVARGYVGRAALTAEKFVPDPFSATSGARLYRTGDRARFGADGNLEFLGRADFQVKVRGYRIELGEIESVLSAHPAVAAAVVVVREDAADDRRIVAYAVLREPGAATAESLREALAETLPESMVPAAIVVLESLPTGATGKVDRKALPAPDYAAPADRYVAPRTPAEETLAAIWARVLGIDEVGVHDDFFALGGHSLPATRVVSRVREVFGVEVGLRALFEAPTVAGLAARIEALRRAGLPALPPVARADRSRPLPLSFAQERLWFIHQLQPGSVLYSMPRVLRLSGALDVDALQGALGDLLRRHEALRTTFRDRDGVPEQVVSPFEGFALAVEDLSALDERERAAEGGRHVDAEIARPFDLEAGPLFRATLLRRGAEAHVLLLNMHHMVSDGWSMDVLERELLALYAARRDGAEAALPALPVQYADHAAWQREHLAGEVLDWQLAWWRERLAGAPALLELPTDHPRPPIPTYRGGHERVHLRAEAAEGLRALARGEGATLYMVLLGAFQLLLSRYAGTDDVVVGTTIAGRTRAEVEGLIGLFMNTLVLRTDLSGDPTFRQALRRVREVTLGAFEHQDVPFERLVTELKPERSLSRNPLFQVLFELNDTGRASPGAAPVQAPADEPGGARADAASAVGEVAKFDLSLALEQTPRGVEGILTYSADLFSPATGRRMARHLVRVLEQVAADPDARLSAVTLLDAEEHATVVEAWNRTSADFPAGRCIHQLFEAQADRTPDAVAVVFGTESLTYAELDARANRIARYLAGRGVGPEVRVGLCLERGMEMLPAILGVMKAGGAYVPVDPSHPAERIGYVLGDSAVAVVLTQARLADALPLADGVTLVRVDAEWEAIAAESPARPQTAADPENLAYVIYTSGSTGRPKGVAMHHRGVCNYIDWGIGFYGADRGNGSPVFSSMAVDLTLTNLLPLFCGKPVHLLPEENAVEALAEALRGRPGFGAIKITPVHLTLLTPLLSVDEAREAAHTLVIGADFLPAEPTVFWQDNAPGVRLMNEYGPTETVVGCSAYVLPPGKHRAGAVPVGGPIQKLRFYVLDAAMRPVPVGVPGELYIGGVGVARGYLGRPGLSAGKFVPDPFAGSGARMYRSGDRARWEEGGDLMIVGRTDNQVKIRGYRVELGEVEAVLRRHEAVTGCLAVVREDRPGDRRLVAYVAAEDGAVDAAALREHLRRTLPEHMVPDAFVLLPSLPGTATGKIDPRTLPAPAYGSAEDLYVAPRTPVEEVLAEVWAEVLGCERVGVHDGFFELGGHSLLAMRLLSRVHARFGLHLSIRAVFVARTLEAMAAEVERLAWEMVQAMPEDEAEALAAAAPAGGG